MGNLIFILGKPGTGKSFSLRNFPKDELGVLNVQGKILPFKGSGQLDIISTDDSNEILAGIKKMSKKYKAIVVDDFQYVMANEFMRRSTEKGYDKFTDIGRHAWDIADAVRDLPADVNLYILCHTDTDPEGLERLKTIGKLLDEKIFLEGMSTIVLKTAVSDGKYTFLTQNNGKDTVKSPYGMFPTYAIENDLYYVDQKIRSYYQIGDYKTDEEMADADAAAAHEEIKKEEPKKKRGSKEKKEELAEAPEEVEKEETAAERDPYAGAKEPFERARRKVAAEREKKAPGERSKRISEKLKEERAAVEQENLAKLAEVPEGVDEEAPFDGLPAPELDPMPRRKKRTVDINEIEPVETPEKADPPVRRRGRRRT